jgi:metal-responsive CopG/Arc/MetJ family transcriptional regulator
MARREVLVQLDDDLVEQLDRIAKSLATNRSELLRRGAQAVIDIESERSFDAELVAAYKRKPPEVALVQAASKLAAKSVPPW